MRGCLCFVSVIFFCNLESTHSFSQHILFGPILSSVFLFPCDVGCKFSATALAHNKFCCLERKSWVLEVHLEKRSPLDSLVVHLYKRLRVLLLLFPKRCHLLSRRSPQSIAKATVARRSRGYWRLARPVV